MYLKESIVEYFTYSIRLSVLQRVLSSFKHDFLSETIFRYFCWISIFLLETYSQKFGNAKTRNIFKIDKPRTNPIYQFFSQNDFIDF